MNDQQILTAILSFAGIVIAAVVAARVGKAGTRENALIDQLQEDLKSERGEREKLAVRVDELFTKVQTLIVRESLWEMHATRVEAQVEALGGTPVMRPSALS